MTTLQDNTATVRAYLDWLAGKMKRRLLEHFSPGQPAPPMALQVPAPDAALPVFINQYALSEQEQLLLLMALAPHVDQLFYDNIIQSTIDHSGQFPELGGLRIPNFYGMLPTGETALFVLAGTDWQQRMEARALFAADHLFAERQVLWLEPVPQGQPTISGKLVLSPEYVDLFLTGVHAKPRFSTDFPAERITTPLHWDELVLNAQTMEQVQELRKWLQHKEHLRHQDKRLKPGYRALFYGPPGTGKTLTASLLGQPTDHNPDGYDVYRIDLSMMVSKYIGETEKNLSSLFAKAEHKDWILFFDEADALFGKRTSIRDAHDKYANQEISYLLQRIENYNGLVILASNFKTNIDNAFARRFQSIIHFPMPDAGERLTLWRGVLPDHLLQQPDVLDKVAGKYELSGASILNVAQYCFLKKMDDQGQVQPITQQDIEEGVIREFSKEGKVHK